MRSVSTTVENIRTHENADDIVDEIQRSGISLQNAGEIIGVNGESVRSWAKDDRVFSDRCRRARAIWMRDRGLQLAEVNPETGLLAHPREVAWLLAKHAPQEYGDVVRHEVSGQVGHVHITAEQLAALHQREREAIEDVSSVNIGKSE